MADTSRINNTVKQKFSATAPVVNLVEGVDYIFNKLGISKSSFRNPSARNGKKPPGTMNRPNHTKGHCTTAWWREKQNNI